MIMNNDTTTQRLQTFTKLQWSCNIGLSLNWVAYLPTCSPVDIYLHIYIYIYIERERE